MEKHLYPVLPRLLRHIARGDPPDARLVHQLRTAAGALRGVQRFLLDRLEITLSAGALAQFARLGKRLDRLAAALERPAGAGARDLLSIDDLAGSFADEIEATIDALRADFVGEVLVRLVCALKIATVAAREVNSISRQIYFISINASVEAARAGDAGRGFAVIGQQIRTLSQDASAALHRLAGQGAAGGGAGRWGLA